MDKQPKKSDQGAGEVLWTALAVVLLLLEDKNCRTEEVLYPILGLTNIGLTNGCKLNGGQRGWLVWPVNGAALEEPKPVGRIPRR